MQIVIDIPSNMYDWFNNGFPDEDNAEKLWQIVKNGVSLPKGHGRLIDADALGEELHRYTEAPYQYALKVFNDAPTIIEAESEDKG